MWQFEARTATTATATGSLPATRLEPQSGAGLIECYRWKPSFIEYQLHSRRADLTVPQGHATSLHIPNWPHQGAAAR